MLEQQVLITCAAAADMRGQQVLISCAAADDAGSAGPV